jgi:hypothetical protein
MKKPETTFLNLWGEQVTVNFSTIHPMFFAWGLGPEGTRCKACVFFGKKHEHSSHFKCDMIHGHNGQATDHRANWPSCKKFIERIDP